MGSAACSPCAEIAGGSSIRAAAGARKMLEPLF